MSVDAVAEAAIAVAAAKEHADNSEMIWYLGYGSNMNSKVLSGRRQVFPIKSLPVVVPGYQLTFDMAGLPYWEPGFGAIKPVDAPSENCWHCRRRQYLNDKRALLAEGQQSCGCQVGEPLHCIAHLITKKELRHIMNTEGGNGNPDFGYQLVDIQCKTYSGQKIVGVSLVDPSSAATGYRPSVRYRQIILDGAIEHCLSPSYIRRLEAVTPYTAKTPGQKVAKYMFLLFGLPLCVPVVLFAALGLVFKTKVPRAVAVYGELVKIAMWTLHDWVFAPVFGKGC